jgi:hypothetical protein
VLKLKRHDTAKGASKMGIDIKIPTRNPGMKEVLASTQTKHGRKIKKGIESAQ